ncbi:hypothetical protein Tco_0736714 [Tanacetum coccineum]
MNGPKITNLTQETLLGQAFRLLKGTRTNYVELEYDFEECYKALSEKLDWENPEGVDYFFNNDLKYLQGGVSTMTYTTSITKTKAAQYDLPGIEDMVPNIWVPVKVAYDKHALWGISHWREQRKTFYGYARGLESRHDVYSTKRILAVTQVEVMRKHGYGYLKEIVVRIVDNDLYTFNEGEFPRLCINDIEDMLLLVVQSRLTNHSGDDAFDFAIALRMFTRSLRRWSALEKKRANIMIKAIDNQLKERRMMRSLEKFIEHQSDTKVITMMMEILLEPTSNKLLLGRLDAYSSRIKLVDNLEKKQWSILTDLKIHIKMDMERRSVKVKELQERCIIKAFKLSYQENYEHVGPKLQDHKMARLQDDVKRLCLVDDLKKFKITFISSQSLKLKITTTYHKLKIEVKDYELKTKTRFIKAIYGKECALNSPSSLYKCSLWLDIIREVTVLRTKGINLLDLIRKKVGNGLNTLFWEDPWLDGLALKHKFLRLYALNNYKQIIVVEKINHASMVDTFRQPPRGGAEEEQLGFLLSCMDGLILTNIPDRWAWSLEATGEFSIKFVRQLIDDLILPKEEVVTRTCMIAESFLLSGAVSLGNPFNLLFADEDFNKGFNIVIVISPSLSKIFRRHALLFEDIKGDYNNPVAFNSKSVSKLKKTGGLRNKQNEHKKAMSDVAKRSKIERSKCQKKIKQRSADEQFRGHGIWTGMT